MGFREEVLKRIDKARDLPTLPGVFAKLDKIIANKNSSASNVAALAEEILKTVEKSTTMLAAGE